MKNTFVLLTLLFLIAFSNDTDAQVVYDWKIKTASNAADRTKILDILRARMYESYKQEFIFVVNSLKVSGGYAWMMGEAQRKDGKRIVIYDDISDCCHVEALFKKSGDKWYLVDYAAFATDVWYYGIWERTGAPKKLFSIN